MNTYKDLYFKLLNDTCHIMDELLHIQLESEALAAQIAAAEAHKKNEEKT